MTQYSDLPKVNALYAEQQQIQSAIKLIDAGGTLSSIAIAPPPPPPYDPAKPMAAPTFMMTANVTNVGTVAPETMSAIKAQLEERDSEITAQLATLGVAA